MSKWQSKINEELGVQQRFTKKLEQSILQQATKKRQKNFTYPVLVVAACSLLLFLLFSLEKTDLQQASAIPTPLNHLIEQVSVTDAYVSYVNHTDDQFFARPTTFAMGVKKLNVDDTLDIVSVLREARLSNSSISAAPYHIVLRLEDGSLKKLVVSVNDGYVGIYDVDTKLSYQSEGASLQSVPLAIEKKIKALGLFIVTLFLSYVFVCGTIRERLPQSHAIFGTFLGLVIIDILLLSQNANISVWLPVVYLIGRTISRYYTYKKLEVDIEKLALMKRSTILLIVWWGCIFIQQLLGGI